MWIYLHSMLLNDHYDIVPLQHINNVGAIHGYPDAQMIKRYLIIPINKHLQYYSGVAADILELKTSTPPNTFLT